VAGEATCGSATAQRATLHANRAAARLRLRRYAEAEEDCSAALALDERYVKARRGAQPTAVHRFCLPHGLTAPRSDRRSCDARRPASTRAT
jgi:hypothetical protein